MAKAPTFVGIDLGTTYSAVAHLNNHGKVEIIPNERSQPVTPSVVMFPEGNDEEPIVGERARRMARFSNERVIECVKRHIGDATIEYEVGGETYTPEEISAVILRELRNIGQLHLSREVKEAVITVPAYFDDGERNATKLAGELAGFKVLGILNEPTAAALAFGLDHAVEKGIALIYDLGGGTFDVSVVELDGGNIRVLATDGVRLLGGVDWDSKLLEYAAHEFMVKHGPDPREDLRSMQRLADEVEAAKRSLSSHSRAKLFLECGDIAGQVLITREKFEDLTEGLLLQTEAYTEAVLEKAELEWSDIDRILLAGGSTRMPMVRSMLKELSGMEPDTSLNPDECVAIGACYYATKLKSESPDGSMSTVNDALRQVANSISVENVASHSIGIQSVIEGKRQNMIMIPEQTPLPHEVTRYFATHADNQVTVEVKVLEGDSDDPEDCNLLGKAVIKGLPANRKRGSKISVTYVYNEEGILTVKAQDVESGQNCEATIQRGASDAPEYVQAMRERLDALYMLEGETADEVAQKEQEERDDSRTEVTHSDDFGEDYDDSYDEIEQRSAQEDPTITTGHMLRIQDDLTSIASSDEIPVLTEEEYGEPVASIGGELHQDSIADSEGYEEGLYDEDAPYPVDPVEGVAAIETRDPDEFGQDDSYLDDGGETAKGEYVDPWQMAADQGLLDGEVLAADDASIYEENPPYEESLESPQEDAPNPYESELDADDTQQGYYEDSEENSLAMGSQNGDHAPYEELESDEVLEPEGYRMSDDLDQSFGSYDPAYGDPEDTYESESEPEGYRESIEEEPEYETMKDGVPKNALGEGDSLDKSDYED